VLSDRVVGCRPTAGPQSVSSLARSTALVGRLPCPVHPSHALATSRSAWLPSAKGNRDVGCSKDRPRLRRFSLTERQSVDLLPRTEQRARWLAPASPVLNETRSIRGVFGSQVLRTDNRAYSWTERVTTRFSSRSRASRPLPGSHGGVGLRTVSRKGRATRPAAERERYTYLQERTAFLQVVAVPSE
jgi:hypothetical protein